MSSEFETTVMTRLNDISTKLSSIEEKIDEATSFTDSVLGEGGVMPSDGMEALKKTFSSLLNPEAFNSETFNPEAFKPEGFASETSSQEGFGQGPPESIGDLVASLKTFQERLASVKEAVTELPKEDEPPNNDEE